MSEYVIRVVERASGGEPTEAATKYVAAVSHPPFVSVGPGDPGLVNHPTEDVASASRFPDPVSAEETAQRFRVANPDCRFEVVKLS